MLELRHNLFGVVKRQLVEKVEAKQSMSDQEYLTYLVLDKQINDLKILEKANDLSQKILQQVKKPVGVIAKYLVENNVENFHFEIICKDANNKILFHF
ncbi:MAG: hypothetical protein BGO39_28970 [Chloroflexi bacterium 54-19]|nr:MAG: hypothetical protein BGO39_28970 [Chloroflexi bacterium 54-19]